MDIGGDKGKSTKKWNLKGCFRGLTNRWKTKKETKLRPRAPAPRNTSENDQPSIPDVPLNTTPALEKSKTAIGETVAVADLWQEALTNVQQSDDWKADREEYEATLNECRKVNHDTLAQSNRSLADAISHRLSTICNEVSGKQWVFRDPVNTVVALDPTNASAIIWGFIQFFVGRVIASSETRDLALDQEPVAHLTSRCALIERCYIYQERLEPSVSILLRKRLVSVYTTILLYQFAVYGYMKKGKITHGIQSLVPIIPVANEELLLGMDEKLQPLSKIGGQVQQVLDLVRGMEETEYSEVLKWISPILHMDHHNQIKPMEETGKWLLEHPNFVSWRESHQSGLLWLRGNMGTGKSNLASMFVSHILKQDHLEESALDEERLAFFYIDRTSRARQAGSVDDILRSLLKQLTITCANALFKPVVAKYKALHDTSSLHRDDCVSLLQLIIQANRQVSFVIDAVDELDDASLIANLVKELKGLIDSCQGTIVKIFITSRNDMKVFLPMNRMWEDRREIPVDELNREDIERFIDMKVDRYCEEKPFRGQPIPKSYRKLLKDRMREKSGGMFRWVDLSLEYLRQLKVTDPMALVAKLNSVPPDLMELYAKVFDSIKKAQDPDGPDIVRRVLSWLMYAQNDRLLGIGGWAAEDESPFLAAVNYGFDGKHTDLTEDDIQELCSGFVTLDDTTGRFRLIHLSVKEFLQEQPEYTPEAGHAFLAASCVAYLSENCIEFQPNAWSLFDEPEYRFNYYVGEYWARHCDKAERRRHEQPLAGLLDSFWPWPGREASSTFHQVVSCLQERQELSRSGEPLIYGELCSLTVNDEPSAFFLACQYDLRDIVEAYLESGLDINRTASNGLTGLFFACVGEKIDLVSYLLSRGITVSCSEEEGRPSAILPAISLACSGRCEILDQLLAHSGDYITESELKYCLSTLARGKSSPTFRLDQSAAGDIWSIKYVEETLEKLISHMSAFHITNSIAEGMFGCGVKVTRLLLSHNPSFQLTDETLKSLVTKCESLEEAIDIFKVLHSFGHRPLDQQEFHLVLSTCRGWSAKTPLLSYFLELNSTISISLDAALVATRNYYSAYTVVQALFELNPFMPVNGEVLMQAMTTCYDKGALLQLLLHHAQSLQVTSKHIQVAVELDTGRSIEAAMVLLDNSRHLEVTDEVLNAALRSRCATKDLLERLISQMPSVELTTGLVTLIENPNNHVVLKTVIASNPPERITEDLVRAATNNDCVSTETLQELLKRAPAGISLPEVTIEHRWPEVPLSETCLKNAIGNEERLRVIFNARPSLKLEDHIILSVCRRGNSRSPAVMQMILARQPNTAITEEMIDAVVNSRGYCEPELLEILLSHNPRFEISESQLLSASRRDCYPMSNTGMVRAILTTRPHIRLTPDSFVECCAKANRSPEFLDMIIPRLQGNILGEELILSVTSKCVPRVLKELLCQRLYATITDAIVAEAIHRVKIAIGPWGEAEWLSDSAKELFAILLARSDLSETERQQRRDEFDSAWAYNMRVQKRRRQYS
ncbi:hypothetical protein BDV38DRAFT_277717 [Aspergillus pseudotamarii]|uniref:Nephrocystin 3-like N-terminal domain-containing protein n=1 Tax=Aspergillus pseudotamarii TaxID=132259 RepID=A0A5N6T954_ASPPS|nr:uncharacterized protein BDV38DRAFT_277717 [Aspergillus pseudotamarii]KAE8142904.1 hypothetical protein BDV38DRAFT_277717 [Aspergillus pseudotamarii]